MAIELMEDAETQALPVVESGKYLGMLQRSVAEDSEALRIGVLAPRFLPVSILASTRLPEIAELMRLHKLTLLPVVDEQQAYQFCVSAFDVLGQLSAVSSVASPGGILVLQVGLHDYSLSEMARLVESNNASIIAAAVTSPSENLNVEVTLKVNTTDLNAIIATFERFEYKIIAYEHHPAVDDFYEERWRGLMAYLRV
jgi:CBS domain-containing protein